MRHHISATTKSHSAKVLWHLIWHLPLCHVSVVVPAAILGVNAHKTSVPRSQVVLGAESHYGLLQVIARVGLRLRAFFQILDFLPGTQLMHELSLDEVPISDVQVHCELAIR